MNPDANTRALVLFSGGQDSTVCLAWALDNFAHVETLGFDYGQRHRVELQQRLVVRDAFLQGKLSQTRPRWAQRLGDDHVLDLSVLGQLSDSALTSDREIALLANGLPSTFVPARNLVFLTLASALAYRRSALVLVGGMCETDFSGYPDCRHTTLQALQTALALGLAEPMRIETPLMWKDKAQTWAMALALGGEALVEVIVEHTHTCYLGERSTRHAWGYGCISCPACQLRAAGWRKWQNLRSD